MILLVCAVKEEEEHILSSMKRRREFNIGGRFTVRGRLSGKDVVVARSGPGKVNAGVSTALSIERFAPEIIINFGIGGLYPGAGGSDTILAVAEKEIYADEGVLLEKGFHGLSFMKLSLATEETPPIFNEIPVDKRLFSTQKEVVKKTGLPFAWGAFLTVSTVTGTDDRARQLRRRYGAVCENMEGASVGHVAYLYGIPFGEIRGISNLVGRRNRRYWRVREASISVQEAIISVIDAL